PRRLAMGTIRIGVIGDRDDSVTAHRAVPLALGLPRDAHRVACEWDWLPTTSLLDLPQDGLDAYHGFWAVPATPYRSAGGAMRAIRFARESGRAFLGPGGGFQQALLEYAGSVWGVARPAHAETDPDAADPVIAVLSCALVETSGKIVFRPGSR